MARYVFNVGFRYYYWPAYKQQIKPKQHQHNRFDHGGYEPHQLYIEAKYKSLKDEILSNTHCNLTIKEFKWSWNKATSFITTNAAKSIKSQGCTVYDKIYKMYDIPVGSPLTMQHVVAVILYCDWTFLSTEFSKTFRRTTPQQTLQDIIKNNREFAVWSRTLRETVELYGEDGSKCIVTDENGSGAVPIYPARGPFYCGINKLMPIPEFSIRLCSPTSTSKQLTVAGRFGGDNGIIIRLNNCGYTFGMKLRSFNCSWLSRFSAEDERLFFGGASRIQIEGIRNIKEKVDYGIYVKALYQFHCVINGSSVFHLSVNFEYS